MKKVLIAGVILILLGIVARFAIDTWMDSNKKELQARGSESRQEGRAYGARTDRDGCVDEALRRTREEGGLISPSLNNLFLSGCLEASRGRGFCKGVPEPTSILEAVAWRLEECADRGYEDDPQCSSLVGSVVDFCKELRHQRRQLSN